MDQNTNPLAQQFQIDPQDLAAFMQAVAQHEHDEDHDHAHDHDGPVHCLVTGIEPLTSGLTRIKIALPEAAADRPWQVTNTAIRLVLDDPSAEASASDSKASTPEASDSRTPAPATPPSPGLINPLTTLTRIYTVSGFDPTTRTLTFDMVVHPGQSPAMQWLNSAEVGDQLTIVGPREHQIPGPGHLRILAADASALPATLSIIENHKHDGPTLVVLALTEADFDFTKRTLNSQGTTENANPTALKNGEISLVKVNPNPDGTPLADALKQLELPTDLSVWAAGERGDMKSLRRWARQDLGLDKDRVQVFGYWKHGMSNSRMDVERLRGLIELTKQGITPTAADDLDMDF